ncbi:ABC transporter [Rhodanobacter sp. Root627]|uniref:ABC transporter permease n=1 Tax=Rhodanobacter sp. Root627 TaxID=1736572 RepID=UPI0006F9021F|nr:FtsX-like permease family protein [Rhodanobacter sp. Root627]KRA32921.1 ABC transporter [Rhodanobacter sp. Root627]
MSMRIHLSVLRRHSLMPALVVLQVALACAILCNVLFLVQQKLAPLLAPSGVAADQLILIDQMESEHHPWTATEVRHAELTLRGTPGVRGASAAFGLPMVPTALMDMALQGANGVKLGVNGYVGDGLVKTLGLQLVAGRDFLPDEYHDFGVGGDGSAKWEPVAPQPIIITRALADQLFDDGHALGKVLLDPGYLESHGHGYRVVGIVQHLLRNQLQLATDGRADNTVLLARRIGSTSTLNFAVRVDPSKHDAVLKQVATAIQREFGARMKEGATARVSFYSERRAQAFQSRRAALWLFAGVTLAVVIVTVIGIMGLTGFWVQKRTRQIGIRRALGARKADILRYFLVENLLIVGVGIAIGMLLASLGNRLLMRHYELAHLPWTYLPWGALMMVVLSQLAVLGPALRASAVPPVVATRSV